MSADIYTDSDTTVVNHSSMLPILSATCGNEGRCVRFDSITEAELPKKCNDATCWTIMKWKCGDILYKAKLCFFDKSLISAQY